MSRWRRIALQELPCCKRAIEEAKSPNRMWIGLREDFEEALRASPPEAQKAKRILNFVLRCERGLIPERVGSDEWLFFNYVLGSFIVGNSTMREHLPHMMPEADFERWIVGIADTPEEIAESRSAFYAARHRKKK